MSSTPAFSSLPLQKSGPRGNAWGLFGSSDELGMLNRLTPENTLAASKEIVYGVRIATDWSLAQPETPFFGRQAFHQEIKHKAPRTVNDDILTLNTQSSSQWDGFRHFGYQDHKVYFNGCQQEDIHNSTKNGTHVWVENGGVVGRGVLLDYASWAESQGLKPSTHTFTPIPLSDLQKIAEAQGITFKPADILFIRTGYIRNTEAMSLEDANTYATQGGGPIPAIGIESCEEMLRWLWENEFAAVVGDQPSLEAAPFASTEYCLHEWMLAGWGMPIGELFDLEKLAVECKKYNKYTFFFSSVPLNVPGGVASPPNGVAIL
ncbi:hypothetical protein BP6252_12964 [Coleophoma cylindrospora]|uniref:Cyclase n=1 Tax=Coleophoma cylindrospora TaxID=1849047 RepID=A0A3D8QDS5_9HELO|nr:hypothetical protein BP6252_12964 [Coleophoma cylindrospora]